MKRVWKIAAAAALTWLTLASVAGLWASAHHNGPWIIGRGEDGDELAHVSPAEYRRHEYIRHGTGLLLAGVLWWPLIASLRRAPNR